MEGTPLTRSLLSRKKYPGYAVSLRLWLARTPRLHAIVLLLAFSAAAHAQSGYGTTSDGFDYSAYNGQISISGYHGNAAEVSIPGTINFSGTDLPVTSIGSYTFSGNVTSVTIPRSVTSIGDGAFEACTGLKSIEVDASNPNYCSVNGVVFDKNQTTLVEFPPGQSGTAYVIPGSVTTIGETAFEGCARLPNVTIPESVTSIGDGAFGSCTGLTSVTIPDSVTSIGASAFFGCTGLTSLTIPGSVTSIRDGAFNGCSGLTNVTILNGAVCIPYYAFNGCSRLTSVSIPASVTIIGGLAFSGCSALGSVTLPEGVTTIGGSAFDGCSSLTRVAIPASVTSLDGEAFVECLNLKSIDVDASNPNYSSVDGILFDKTQTTLLTYPGGKSDAQYVIPGTVTKIGDDAFFDNRSLTRVTIPEGVTSIGLGAFSECNSLTSVVIPSSVTSIGDWAFQACPSLQFAVFMGKAPTMGYVQAIGDSVFDSDAKGFTVYFLKGATGFTLLRWKEYRSAEFGQIREGAVQVFITPAGAESAGARWKVDGGAWHKSGAFVGGLSEGTHVVTFKAVSGRATPFPQSFTVKSFQMASVTGTYWANPAESFTGMFNQGAGLVSLVVTNTGKFTGVVSLPGQTYRLNGAFDANGDYVQVIGKPAIPVALHLDPSLIGGNPSDVPITGSINGEALVAFPAAFDRDHSAGLAGTYTLLLRPTAVDGSQSPRGTGYARMIVSSAGIVTMSGRLADNTSFSASGPITGGSNGNQFFLFNPTLYHGKGLVAGTVTFESLSNSDCDGSLQWFKPSQKSGGYFKNGFNTELAMVGQHYIPPSTGQPALPISTGTLKISGGSLENPISETVALLSTNVVQVEGANTEKLKVTFSPSTGLFSGSFIDPASKGVLSFGGVLYQNQAAPQAAGFFLGPILSGTGWSGNVSLTQ